MSTEYEAAAPCPCCGAYTGTTLAESSPLLAVCDVLVIRALEVAGKRIVRAERSRFRTLGTRPWHAAHTIWRPSQDQVVKSLEHAWDVVPALLDTYGCCNVTARQVVKCLDTYAGDLLITGTAHDLDELRYRFSSVLGIDVPMPSQRYADQVVHESPMPRPVPGPAVRHAVAR
jgi:hypothetical protein